MTKLLEQAIEKVKRLPEAEQDAYARWLLAVASGPRMAQSADVAARLVERMQASTKTLPPDFRFNRQELYEEGTRG